VKTWTEALKEEERLHTCRVGEIQNGCPSGWEKTCAPQPPGRDDGGWPPHTGRAHARPSAPPGRGMPLETPLSGQPATPRRNPAEVYCPANA
jgi:hypothetical protein